MEIRYTEITQHRNFEILEFKIARFHISRALESDENITVFLIQFRSISTNMFRKYFPLSATGRPLFSGTHVSRSSNRISVASTSMFVATYIGYCCSLYCRQSFSTVSPEYRSVRSVCDISYFSNRFVIRPSKNRQHRIRRFNRFGPNWF